MPAIIKIVITINLVIMLTFLQQTDGMIYQKKKLNSSLQYSKAVPTISGDNIILKWMNTETTIRKAYLNLIKSLLPTAYGMSISSNLSQNCTRSFVEYISGLMNMKAWALKMFDSTGKIPNGLFGGTPMAFGDFDTCMEIESPSRKFRGQYCYVEVELPLPKRKVLTPIEEPVSELQNVFDPESIVNHLAEMARFLYNSQLRLTVCIPSSCSKEDLRLLSTNVMMYLKIDGVIKVPHCEAKEDTKFTALEIFIMVIFSLIICLVIAGTVIDVSLRLKIEQGFKQPEKSTLLKFILCYSAYTNFKNLVKKDNSPESLNIFHGLRVISMLWIMLSHAYLAVNYHGFDTALSCKDIGKSFYFQLITNGFLAVENFLFMSSVLVSYVIVRMRGRINIAFIFFKRYMRLTPTMMLVAGLFGIAGRFGSGPLWRETVADSLSKNCLERGWINLFYMNNFLYSSKTCLGWTWYLSTDTQMFLVSLYVSTILRRKPGRGLLSIVGILIFGICSTAFSHFYYKLPPTYLQSFLNFEDWYFYAVKGYTQVHFHFPVCSVGLVVGYILATKKGYVPKHINAIGYALTAMTFLTLLCLTHKWNQGYDSLPNVFTSAVFGSTHRFVWALCMAFITLSCTWGHGGIVNSILSWEGFVPLGRLTYMVYLVHYGLVYIHSGSQRQTMTFGHRAMLFLFFNNVVVSFLLAFLLSLLFESPFMAMDKTFSDGSLKKQIQPISVVHGSGAGLKDPV